MQVYGYSRIDRRTSRAVSRWDDVLRHVIAGLKRRRSPHARVARAWEQVAPHLADQTEVISLEHGVLTVAVASSALRAELQGFTGPALLQQLRATPAGRDVVEFRTTLRTTELAP